MPINSDVRANSQSLEAGKFVELVDDTLYPPVSVVRVNYPPGITASAPVSTVEVYPKYAVLTHLTNASDIQIALSAANLNVNLADVEGVLVDSNATLDTISNTLNTAVTTIQQAVSALNQQLGQSGFDFLTGGQSVTGQYTTIQVVSTARIASITTSVGSTGALTQFDLPQGFVFNGPITALTLSSGAIFAYRK